MFLRNALTALRHPSIAAHYGSYLWSRCLHQGNARRRVAGRLLLTGFSGFSEYLSAGGAVQTTELSFFENVGIPKGVIIDVGANLGTVSILLDRRFPDRNIHALEANPLILDSLLGNIALNRCGNVHVHSIAVADRDGTVAFEANPKDRATASITNSSAKFARSVKSTTLDSFVRHQCEWSDVALLKVDVEGFECAVFKGAANLLQEGKIGVVYFEVCPNLAERRGYLADEAARILIDSGIDLYRLDPSGSLVPADVAEVSEVTLENWIGLRANLGQMDSRAI